MKTGPPPETPTFLVNKSFAAVSRASTGVYCLTPAAGVPTDASQPAPVTSQEFTLTKPANAFAAYVLNTTGIANIPLCPPNELRVITYDGAGNERATK